jgi:2-desacetyl-2-hydroxyethyl bacteriochlorophyllide A dehydrogenase
VRLRVLGVHIDGGMQGLLRLPLAKLHPAGRLDPDQVALVETLSVGARAVRRAGVKVGERALLLGAGPIGLATLVFARLAGAEVDVVEPNRARWSAAIASGADQVHSDGDALGSELYPVVFDATGNRASMERSFERVEHAGRLVFVGFVPERISFDDRPFHTRELTLLASRNSAGEFPRIIELLAAGRIELSGWITHRLRLDEVPARFGKICEHPKLVKAMIDVPAWASE